MNGVDAGLQARFIDGQLDKTGCGTELDQFCFASVELQSTGHAPAADMVDVIRQHSSSLVHVGD